MSARAASTKLCSILVFVALLACSANPPKKEGDTEVIMTPPTSSVIEPAPAQTPADPPPPEVTAKPAPPPIDPAAACLFCRTDGKKCVRPDVGTKLATLTCGDGDKLIKGKIEGTPVDCNPGCCPAAKGKGKDADADGLTDEVDKCPDDPEDREGFQDSDGCPDADNDQDGVKDTDDKCCFGAEDPDGKEDLDGCAE